MASCQINITGTYGQVRIRYTLNSVINVTEAGIGDPVFIDSTSGSVTYTTINGDATAASTCLTITNLYPGTNPCISCGCNPQVCSCPDPIYTEVGCPNTLPTRCVELDGADMPCINVAKPITLRGVLDSLVVYTKNALNRLTNTDGSLVITPTSDACNDKSTIRVKVSTTSDNTLTLNGTGLYVPPNTGSGITAVASTDSPTIDFSGNGTSGTPLTASTKVSADVGNTISAHSDGLYSTAPTLDCATVSTLYTTDALYFNTIDPTTYKTLSNSASGCKALHAPSGFAVTGATRTSAYGKMEWYSTLNAANIAAAPGETVLIYTDSTDNILAKDGVHYHSVGVHSIGNFTSTVPTPITLVNLKISNLSLSVDADILTTGVSVYGTASITDSKWRGGNFYDDTKTFTINGTGLVSDIYSEKSVSVTEGGQLSNFNIKYSGTDYALDINSVGAEFSPRVTKGNVLSTAATVATFAYNNASNLYIADIVSRSTINSGVYIQCGLQNTDSTIVLKNVIGVADTSGVGLSVVSSRAPGDTTPTMTNYIADGCIGYSNSGDGIFCLNGTLRNSEGYSKTGYGIHVGGSENPGDNMNIINCIGESKASIGLYAQRDIYISGGTFISRLNSSFGNPIYLSNSIATHGSYYIVGATTVSTSIGAFGIAGDPASPYPITTKIAKCNILSTSGTVTTPIDTTNITITPVTVGAYGNIS